MDWALHGSSFAPSFGSANHHMCDQIARTRPAGRDLALITAAHAEYIECLAQAEGHLARTGEPYLTGSEFSIGDVPLAVELNRWSLCVHRARRDSIVQLDCPAFAELGKFYARMLSRPAFVDNVFTSELQHQTLEDGPDLRRLPLMSATSPSL